MSVAEPLRAPERLGVDHDTSAFACGEATLDDWLRRRALQNQASGASRTYVLCAGPTRVVGYYALAAGGVAHVSAPGRVKRNVPDPIPVMILGRLAVGQTQQGRGLGAALLRDALLRVLQAADIVGIRAILVHAISEQARQFYEGHGFVSSPIDTTTLMVTLADAAAALSGSKR